MLTRHTHAMQNERESNQVNLFGDGFGDQARPPLPDVDDWSTEERLHQEHDAIGFYLSSIPCNPTGKPSIASVWSIGRMCRQGGSEAAVSLWLELFLRGNS